MNYYVSLTGNDNWSGHLPEPSSTQRDGPFRTVERARDAVRAKRARVLIRGGVYELRRPLVFTAADSGTDRHPVVYAAYPGETPVFSGGRQIHGLRPAKVHGRDCWVADVPAGWTFTQLFVNGQRRWRPRLPEQGYYRFARLPKGCSNGELLDGPDRAFYKPGDLRRWRNLADVEIVALQHWFDSHLKIKSVDVRQHLVRFDRPALGNLRDEATQLARYFVENIFEALTEPGQWYLDRHRGKLYYLPRPGESITTATVIAPRLPALVRFAGQPGRPIRQVRLENLSFQHAEWPGRSVVPQAAADVPGAVIFQHAETCALYGCSISKVSQAGVEMMEGCHDNRIVACVISDLGAGGVKIGHEWVEPRAHTTPHRIPRRPRAKPSATLVADCVIHHGSLIYLGAIGIWIGNAGFNQLLHNHVHHFNYTGISCGWTWGYEPTATIGDVIEGNHIHHINWDRVLSDLGGIYTLGERPGCVVRRNHIHHVGGHGIYHDEGTAEQIVEQNLVHHTREAGFLTHYGRDNLVRNNVFALAEDAHFVPAHRRENHRSTTFERNIVYWTNGSLGTCANIIWPTHCFKIQNNLFWAGGRAVDFGHGSRLEDWQAQGQFTGTIIADPLFHDPANGGFTLRADSPARRIGFIPFSVAAVGPRFAGERPQSLAEWQTRFPLSPARPIVRTRLEWQGRQRIRLIVTNVGLRPAAGRLRLVAKPAHTVALTGPVTLAFRALAPGRTMTAEFPIEVKQAGQPFQIETVPVGDGLIPALLYQPAAKVWPVHRLPATATADVNGACLVPVKYIGRPVAAFKMVLVGETLVLHGEIVDRQIRQAALLWQGSCVEFFTAPTHSTARPTQMFLVPAENGCALTVLRVEGGAPVAIREAHATCAPTTRGYRFTVRLPLKLLRLPARPQTFLTELAVGTTLSPTGGAQGRLSLFDAGAAFGNSRGYGLVQITDLPEQRHSPVARGQRRNKTPVLCFNSSAHKIGGMKRCQ